MNDLKKWEKGKKSISRNGIMTYIIVALRYDKERTIFHSFSNHEDRPERARMSAQVLSIHTSLQWGLLWPTQVYIAAP